MCISMKATSYTCFTTDKRTEWLHSTSNWQRPLWAASFRQWQKKIGIGLSGRLDSTLFNVVTQKSDESVSRDTRSHAGVISGCSVYSLFSFQRVGLNAAHSIHHVVVLWLQKLWDRPIHRTRSQSNQMSIVSHVNLRTCTGERAQQHAQRRTSSCITTCPLDAYLVPIFGKWPHSRAIWPLILCEVAKGSMSFGPYSTKVILASSTKSPERHNTVCGPNTSNFLPDCIYHGTWKLPYSSFRAL